MLLVAKSEPVCEWKKSEWIEGSAASIPNPRTCKRPYNTVNLGLHHDETGLAPFWKQPSRYIWNFVWFSLFGSFKWSQHSMAQGTGSRIQTFHHCVPKWMVTDDYYHPETVWWCQSSCQWMILHIPEQVSPFLAAASAVLVLFWMIWFSTAINSVSSMSNSHTKGMPTQCSNRH